MELYILSNNDLSTLAILECSDYNINLDNQFTDKSTFRVNKTDGQIKDNFLVVNGLYQQFLFIIDEVEATDKEEKFVNLVCSDISNVFNRKIIQKDTDLMTSRSIEYFLAHMIDENFINSDDSFLNKSYVEVTYYESTQAKEATNAENGIYNFHTFMENCREHKNVFTDFKFEDGKLKVTIKHKEDTAVIIDTTLPEVTHYNKVYEQDITAKVSVYIRENDTVQNYYLKTDKTITTDKTDPNRATGAIEVISVETADLAYSEAVNVFKGNTYKHLVEFSLNKNSKLVDPTTLYICRPIIIKTPDGIYDSIISGISLQDDEYIEFKSGNIRITFIDKLKQEKENYGDKLDVTGGVIKGNLTTQGSQTISGNATINGMAISPLYKTKFYMLDLTDLSANDFYPVTFPREETDMPLDCEIHSTTLGGASPYNQNVIHFRSVATGWADTPPCFTIYEYGVYASDEITIGCVGQIINASAGSKFEGECVWLRGNLQYRFITNIKPIVHPYGYVPANNVFLAMGQQYYGGSDTTGIVMRFTPQSTFGTNGSSFLGGTLIKDQLKVENQIKAKNEVISTAPNEAFIHKHPISGVQVAFGVGSGGNNRGMWDETLNKWHMYYNGSRLVLNDDVQITGTPTLLGLPYVLKCRTYSSQANSYVDMNLQYDSTNPYDRRVYFYMGVTNGAYLVAGAFTYNGGTSGVSIGEHKQFTTAHTASVSVNSDKTIRISLPSNWATVVLISTSPM